MTDKTSNKSPRTPESTKASISAALSTQKSPEQDGNASEDQSQRLCNIIIVDLNGKEIPLKTVMYEMVFELREILAEHVYTCFFTNFFFEHAGQRLNEYSELSELDLLNNPRIFMKPERYDEKSAQTHVKRLIQILEKPPVLTVIAADPTDSEATKPRSRSNSSSLATPSTSTTKTPSEDKKQEVEMSAQEETPTENQQQPEEQKELLARVSETYKTFNEVVQANKDKEIRTLSENLTDDQAVSTLKHLVNGGLVNSDLNHLKHVKCVESIQYSSFNPVDSKRKLAGDLLYLTVKTLENPQQEVVITRCANGFFRNNSTERTQFSCEPFSRANPCFSYTLAGCLNQLSPLFAKNLTTYLGSILKTEPYFLNPISPVHTNWLQQESDESSKQVKVSNAEDMAQCVTPLYGLDPKYTREWNEEFQVVKNFPADSFMQRVQKDRAIYKIYSDFVEAANEGAKAIVDNKFVALNPNEPRKQQVFVYNQIFFSCSSDTPTNFKDLTSSDQFPSFSQANLDLLGLQQLQEIELPELYHLATCLVDYKGNRVICQSIIPGILNNADLSSLAEYGTVDEKKQIVATDQFHAKMLEVAEKLNIQVTKVVDPANNKSVEIAGSVDVKGIKGFDGRNYIVDVQGLAPRDANYLGEDFHACLVRPELLTNYQRSKNMDHAAENIKGFMAKLDAEREKSEPKAKEGEELSEEQQKKINERRQEDNIKKLKEVERLIDEAPKFQFNTNLFKSNVQVDLSKDELAKQEALLRDVAKFLKENAIKSLVQDLKQQEGVPTDSQSLEAFFHKRGVNMRYLGQVFRTLEQESKAPASAEVDKNSESKKNANLSMAALQMQGDFKHLRQMIEREVVLRSAKHVFNRIIKEESGDNEVFLSQIVSHLLNCLFAPKAFLTALNDGSLKLEDDSFLSRFHQFPEEVQSSPRRASQSDNDLQQQQKQPSTTTAAVSNFEKVAESASQQQPQSTASSATATPMTKTQKKKQKRKQAMQNKDTEEKKEAAQVSRSMADVLFKGLNQTGDFSSDSNQGFMAEDLFTQPILARGLLSVDRPACLSLTPGQLFEEIREIATKRFGFDLPTDQIKLTCLSRSNNKTALLRSLCIKLGIQLVASKDRDFLLGNKIKQIVTYYNEKAEKDNQTTMQSTNGKKKRSMQQSASVLTEADILKDYKKLPFQASDIASLFSNVKQIKRTNVDIRNMMSQGNQAQKEGSLEKAFEIYSQVISVLLQVQGPMNEEVAQCISHIASIQFKFGDFLQAIELQTKAIVLTERLLGVDHPHVGFNYSTLSMYYNNVGYHAKAFESMHRALAILQSAAGDYHPEIASVYTNLGFMYSEIEMMDAAVDSYKAALQQAQIMYGAEHLHTANAYQALARVYFRFKDCRKALENQEITHKMLQNLLPSNSPLIQVAKQQLDHYFVKSVRQEQQKSVIQRPLGENKPVVDPKFMKAISEAQIAQQLMQAKEAAKEEEETKGMSEEQKQERAKKRYAQLVQKLQSGKDRNIVDFLQYQQLREQISAFEKVEETETEKDQTINATRETKSAEKPTNADEKKKAENPETKK